MKRGEVWWVEFDPAEGSVMGKTRPAVIVSNNSANRHLLKVVVIPLSTNISRVYPGESLVTLEGTQGKVMTDQIMAVEKICLKNQVGTLSQADMLGVEQAILVHLGLPK